MEVFVLAVFGCVLVIVPSILLGVWLFRGRCPQCGKLFAARVVGSSKMATIMSVDTIRNPQTNATEEVAMRETGYLVTHRCRYCSHEWERIETHAQRVDGLTRHELDEIRRRQL